MSVASEPSGLAGREHQVCFYATDAELASAIVDYLVGGLTDGAAAILIATAAHRERFERELAASGLDVGRAARDGRLRWLDADDALVRITVGGRIDEAAFLREVAPVLREVGPVLREVSDPEGGGGLEVADPEGDRDRCPQILAFGELVNLLWERGDVEGALELERAWNRLIDEFGFSLLCAYRTTSPETALDDPAFFEVCRLHSSACPAAHAGSSAMAETDIGSIEVSRRFPADVDAPRAARRFLEATLREWGHEGASVADAVLLLSELVTNAVTHARSPVSVSVRPALDGFRLAVRDLSPAQPRLGTPTADAPSGRGLPLVAALSRRWGVDPAGEGKVVWTEI